MHNSVNFADPVRPRGHLVSTVAELALHVINDLRRGAVKRVLPLRFATYLIDGNLDCAEVARAFSKSKNNLHHRQMGVCNHKLHQFSIPEGQEQSLNPEDQACHDKQHMYPERAVNLGKQYRLLQNSTCCPVKKDDAEHEDFQLLWRACPQVKSFLWSWSLHYVLVFCCVL